MRKRMWIISLVFLCMSYCCIESFGNKYLINYNDKIYCQDDACNLLIGWQYIGGEWYYFDENDKSITIGWKKLDDKWYYFDEKGRILHDIEKNIDGVNYVFNSEGAWVENSGTSIINENNENDYVIKLNGKQKEECMLEDSLYRMVFSNRKIDEKFYVNNRNYYDETRNIFYYPIANSNNKCCFMALNFEI